MKKIIALVLVVFAFAYTHTANAAYAQLKPPTGWSQGLNAAVPGQLGTFAYGAAANGSTFKGTTVLTNSALSIAGQTVTVPVALRVAANAASIAAEFGYLNPYLLVGAGLITLAPIAYKWFTDQGFVFEDGSWKKPTPGGSIWYTVSPLTQWYTSQESACSAWLTKVGHSYGLPTTSRYDPRGLCQEMYQGEAQRDSASVQSETRDSITKVPATKEEIISKMSPLPIPDGLPLELPTIKFPVEIPVMNPDPAILPKPSPAAPPLTRPLWVPTGDPVASSPATTPQTWIQPGQQVTGSPTPTDPWRVNVEPLPKSKTNATPNTAPITTTDPSVNNPSAPGTPAEQPDPLCTLFPDILACAKLGTPGTPENVQNTDKPMSINKDPGWGPEHGSCPAPRELNLHFGVVQLPWTSICGLAEGMRPFFVAFAYLGAALSFFGIGRKA